jgi:hypothetical protein
VFPSVSALKLLKVAGKLFIFPFSFLLSLSLSLSLSRSPSLSIALSLSLSEITRVVFHFWSAAFPENAACLSYSTGRPKVKFAGNIAPNHNLPKILPVLYKGKSTKLQKIALRQNYVMKTQTIIALY